MSNFTQFGFDLHLMLSEPVPILFADNATSVVENEILRIENKCTLTVGAEIMNSRV